MRNRVTQVLSIVGRRFISAAVLSALAGSDCSFSPDNSNGASFRPIERD